MRAIQTVLLHLLRGNLMPAPGDFGNQNRKSFESVNHAVPLTVNK